MGQVTDLLQGKPGFEQYNRENEQKIPYKIVILDSVDGNAEQALVRKLLINGPRCGIFVILLQDQSQMQKQLDSDNDKLRMAELSTMIEYGNDVAKVIPAGGQEPYVIKLLEENRDYHDYIAKYWKPGRPESSSTTVLLPASRKIMSMDNILLQWNWKTAIWRAK